MAAVLILTEERRAPAGAQVGAGAAAGAGQAEGEPRRRCSADGRLAYLLVIVAIAFLVQV